MVSKSVSPLVTDEEASAPKNKHNANAVQQSAPGDCFCNLKQFENVKSQGMQGTLTARRVPKVRGLGDLVNLRLEA